MPSEFTARAKQSQASRRHPTIYLSPQCSRKRVQITIRSSAIAQGPRDASCQLKSCQPPRNSAETTCTTSPEPSYQLSLIDPCDKIVLLTALDDLTNTDL